MLAAAARWAALLLLCCRGVNGADELTFTVVDPSQEHGVCCTSAFFEEMMDALQAHPAYRSDPADARIVFVRLDTFRVCMWPVLAIDGEAATCDTEQARARAPPEGVRYECGFCCPFGTDNFVDTARRVAAQYGSNKTFVYFKNSWDNRYECSEFLYAKVAAANLPAAAVRFVGVQLQQSQLTRPESTLDRNEYPIRGVNLLMPLLPDKHDLIEGPEVRLGCVDRKYVASFSGCMTNPVRRKIAELQGNDRYHFYDTNAFGGQDPEGYGGVLLNSNFAFAPGGDEHYSFRLTEVLAAGAIPIVIDDDYVVPYGETDMHEWALFVREDEVWRVPDMIAAITPEQRCSLKTNGTKVFNKAKDVASTADAMVRALWDTRPDVLRAPSGVATSQEAKEAPVDHTS